MGREESVITPPIRGAARTLDMCYPSMQTQTVGDASPGINWIDRQGLTFQDRGTVTNFGVPPAGSGYDLYRGRVSYKQTGNGTAGGFYLTGTEFAVYFPQNKVGGAFQDDSLCWRMVAILAFDSSGLGAGDTGLEIGPAINYDMVTGTPPGFRLGPSAVNAVSLQIRQNGGGAFTVNQVVANPTAVDDWHAYEMRFVGATDKNDAVFKAFFDGVQVASQQWGAGTLLPSWANGASMGYMIGVGNRGANATYIAKMGLQVFSSATEAGLL